MAALVEGVWPRDFAEDGARDVECKGLQTDPNGVFTLMKRVAEKCRIIEERSRHSEKKGKG